MDRRRPPRRCWSATQRLAGGVAHDFNNILTAINGYAGFVRSTVAHDAQATEDVEEIIGAAERAANLTRQLLAFARREPSKPVAVDVARLLLDIQRLLQRLLGADIELVTDVSPGAGTVRIDPSQLEQVIVNFAVNARDAMPGGGTFTTSARLLAPGAAGLPSALDQGRSYVLISFADTGTGIDPEVIEHIFEPFYSTKEPGRGTGLGLATCHGIVARADGHISVESAPGQGAVFHVYLPAAAGSADVVSPVEGSEAARGAGPILVVDDEPHVRALAIRLLRSLGYVVRGAADGEEALAMVRSGDIEPDLVVTDVIMPRQGGADLARELRAIRPSLPIVFVSGYAGDALSGASELPLTTILYKPFPPPKLAEAVQDLLVQAAATAARN